MRRATGIVRAWEQPLFDVARGKAACLPSVVDVAPDELPFRYACRGLLLFLSGDYVRASGEFDHARSLFLCGGLEHFKRGATLGRLAALSMIGREREAVVGIDAETHDLERSDVLRWPYWHPRIARQLAQTARRFAIARNYWSRFEQSTRTRPSLEGFLLAAGLTARESQIVVAWIADPYFSRQQLAEALALDESTVRVHLRAARRKLQCKRARGPAAFLSRLRDFGYEVPSR